MAITWGTRVTRSSGAWQQLGIEAVASGSTITVRYYGDSNGVSGTWTLTRTGSITGGVSVSWQSSGGVRLLHTATMTGTPGQAYSFGASMPVWWGGSTVSVSGVSVTVGGSAIPAPTSASATLQQNAVAANVTWARPAGWDSGPGAWTGIRISQQEVNPDGTWGPQVAVRTLARTATAWTATGLQPNSRYRWIVQATTASGGSPGAATDWVSTTPSAPIGVTAIRSGADILVFFGNTAPHATAMDIEDSWTEEGETVVSHTFGVSTTSPWRHESPSSSTSHRYRVRARVPGIFSEWSRYSDVVHIPAAPHAPTDLSPNGIAVAEGEPVRLSWRHAPVDASGQQDREVRHRPPGGVFASSTAATADQFLDLPGGLAEPGVHAWQVRTRGMHPDWSDWSALASFVAAPRPVVSITGPTGTVNGPQARLTWVLAEQVEWEAEALVYGQVVASARGTTQTSWTTPERLVDGEDATLRVRARGGDGLWSEWEQVTVPVAFVPPAMPSLTVEWEPEFGFVSIVVDAGAGGAGVPETVLLAVERSVDGGPWEAVGSADSDTVALADYEAPLSGPLRYRAVATSTLPSTAVTEVSVVSPHDQGDHEHCSIFVGAGSSFSATLRLRWGPEGDFTFARSRGTREYEGRSRLSSWDGPLLTADVAVSGALMPKGQYPADSVTPQQIQAWSQLPGTFLYRDPDGMRVYGVISPVQVSPSRPGRVGSVSFTLAEAERGTDEQRAFAESLAGAYIAEILPGTYILVGGTFTQTSPGEYVGTGP